MLPLRSMTEHARSRYPDASGTKGDTVSLQLPYHLSRIINGSDGMAQAARWVCVPSEADLIRGARKPACGDTARQEEDGHVGTPE